MWSRSKSALLPISVTALPFTVTRPSRISCSALRREAAPARERIFCSRSSGMSGLLSRCFFGGSGRAFRGLVRHRQTADLLEFLERRQLAQVLQAELHHKLAGGLVENRLADDVLAAGGGDELAVEQRLEHARALHAADLEDFWGGDGLLIGDDRQGLERRQRKLQQRAEALDELANALVVLGFGGHLVAARHFADGYSVLGPVEFRHQIFEQLLDPLARFAERAGNLFGGKRLLGHIDDGFEHRLELHVTR